MNQTLFILATSVSFPFAWRPLAEIAFSCQQAKKR
jgi:hypothetical protein